MRSEEEYTPGPMRDEGGPSGATARRPFSAPFGDLDAPKGFAKDADTIGAGGSMEFADPADVIIPGVPGFHERQRLTATRGGIPLE